MKINIKLTIEHIYCIWEATTPKTQFKTTEEKCKVFRDVLRTTAEKSKVFRDVLMAINNAPIRGDVDLEQLYELIEIGVEVRKDQDIETKEDFMSEVLSIYLGQYLEGRTSN